MRRFLALVRHAVRAEDAGSLETAPPCRHFTILSERLEQLGCTYGSLSVHNGASLSLAARPLLGADADAPPHPPAGLWESATQTSHSLLSRLAIVALVHEARGLDTNPTQIRRCRAAGDEQTARVLEIVHADEICVRPAAPSRSLSLSSASC